MILRFLRTKIGVAALVALFIVLIAGALKLRTSQERAVRSETSLMVEKIISKGLKQPDQIDSVSYQQSTSSDSAQDAENNAPDPAYTATDRFSQQIFKEYVAAKQSGQQIDSDLSDKIAESVLSQDYNAPKSTYSAADIKISGNTSASSLKSYGNSLATILTTAPAAPESELDIFKKIISDPVDPYVSELKALQKRYMVMKSKLLALSAPLDLASAQANVINALDLFIDSIDGALSIDADPIGALTRISRHQAGISLLAQQISFIQTYFRKQGTVFGPKESGYVLTQ